MNNPIEIMHSVAFTDHNDHLYEQDLHDNNDSDNHSHHRASVSNFYQQHFVVLYITRCFRVSFVNCTTQFQGLWKVKCNDITISAICNDITISAIR